MNFDLKTPITWSDIISALSTIGAFLAVIVAMVANRKASKSINSSLQIQEQSKNVDLFDKRVTIAQQIENDEEICLPALKILFSDEAFSMYKNMQSILRDKSAANHDLNVYFGVLRVSDGEGGYISVREEIESRFAELNRCGFPDDMEQEFLAYCKEKSIFYSETGNDEDYKEYNCCTIYERIKNAQSQYEEEKRLLIEKLYCFISDSIKPLEEKLGFWRRVWTFIKKPIELFSKNGENIT